MRNRQLLYFAFTALAFAGAGGFAIAQQAELKNVKGAYEIETPKGIVSIQPLTADIFRVTTLPKDSRLTYRPSQSAVLAP